MQNKFSFLIIITSLTFTIQSCNKNKTSISKSNSNESHNLGQNCMVCHTGKSEAGKKTGAFTVAGSVYDLLQTNANPNATINLYTEPGGAGTLKSTIEVDTKGNFYTTASIDFGAGLYPSIKGSTSTFHMGSPITSGQCSSCHGVTTGKVYVN